MTKNALFRYFPAEYSKASLIFDINALELQSLMQIKNP